MDGWVGAGGWEAGRLAAVKGVGCWVLGCWGVGVFVKGFWGCAGSRGLSKLRRLRKVGDAFLKEGEMN